MSTDHTTYYTGVIEGFYGKPWTFSQRLRLLDILEEYGLNTYIYAPKFDIRHRLRWKKKYPKTFMNKFQRLVQKAKEKAINIVFAISPGVQPGFGSAEDFDALLNKYRMFYDIGCTNLGLFLDDISFENIDIRRQVSVANSLLRHLDGQVKMFFCPSIYSEWHLQQWLGSRPYLVYLGKNLDKRIDVFWTGPTIISPEVTADKMKEWCNLLERKVVFWDNLLANDYLPSHQAFAGPVFNRSPDIRNTLSGHLLNLSELFDFSMISTAIFGEYIADPANYDPEDAWERVIFKLFSDDTYLWEIITGYYFSPFKISGKWNTLLSDAMQILFGTPERNPVDIQKRLNYIKSILSDDNLLMKYPDTWPEIFPLIRDLKSDIDYLKTLLEKRETLKRPLTCEDILHRDPRWQTPIQRFIFTSVSERSS